MLYFIRVFYFLRFGLSVLTLWVCFLAKSKGLLLCHPSVVKLGESLGLSCSCGYITLLHSGQNTKEESEDSSEIGDSGETLSLELSYHYASSSSRDPRKIPSWKAALEREQSFRQWEVFDCVFGLPLFDRELNRTICRNIGTKKLFDVSQ